MMQDLRGKALRQDEGRRKEKNEGGEAHRLTQKPSYCSARPVRFTLRVCPSKKNEKKYSRASNPLLYCILPPLSLSLSVDN